jgi:hypothetical protein
MKLIKSILILFFLFFPCLLYGYTKDDVAKTAVSDGSLADTQNALNYIIGRAQDGWVLTVGSAGGSYSWNSSLQIPAGRTITLRGAGTYSPDTRVTINFTHSQASAISFSATNGKVVRITNFKFTDSGSPVATIQVNGWSNVPSWRIDHNLFTDMADRVIVVGDQGGVSSGIGPYGLVDNNWFQSNGGAYRGLYIFSSSENWTTAMTWGTDQTIVIETNTFNQTGDCVPGMPAVDSAWGARWNARYNTFNNWTSVMHGADSTPCSTLQVEFNHNIMRISGPEGADYGLYIRGGTVVATGNDFGVTGGNTGYNSAFKMVRDGPCGGGYPCFQQVGRGVVVGVEGSVPCYFWNNIYNLGDAFDGDIWSTEGSSDIQLNRDFFLSARPGYTELVYPHPLRGESPPPSDTPAPPVNLQILGR